MKLRRIFCLALVGALLFAQSAPCPAFETDQYNLPNVPLADVGTEVSAYARDEITGAIEKINAKIRAHAACLEKTSGRRKSCQSEAKERETLEKLRGEDTIIRAIFTPLGGGIPPFTNSGTWMQKHEFRVAPARYKTSYKQSIYRTAPVNYLTISETVRLYGVEFGTDKIAHFFQQGYSYYKIFQRARAKNISDRDARQKAVGWGKLTENTYYGTLVGGVYSNADLAANFAGMKFYENLTHEINLGGRTKAPILIVRGGLWAFNESAGATEDLLEPFITEHFNEARNPSVYFNVFNFRSVIRKIVRTQACPQWRARFPELTRTEAEAETDALKLWHGEDYGVKANKKRITIADTCF